MNEERMQYSVSLEYVARIHMFISVLMKEQWKRLCARETLRKTKNIYFIVRVYTRSDVSQELVKKKKQKKKKQQTALKKQKQKQKNDNNNNNEAVKSQLKRKRKALRSDYEPIKKKKKHWPLGQANWPTHTQTNKHTKRCVC